MANKSIPSNLEAMLKFSEVRTALIQAFGSKKTSKKNALDISAKEDILRNMEKQYEGESEKFRQDSLKRIQAIADFMEFMKFNSAYQILEWGLKARNDISAMSQAIGQLALFDEWLVKSKGMSESTALTHRGNFKSLLRYNSIFIKTNDKRDKVSSRKISQSMRGYDLEEKYEILKMMNEIADREMKCFIGLGIACGHRKSDLVNIKVAALKKWLPKNKDFIYIDKDIKQNAIIRIPFKQQQRKLVLAYMATWAKDDDRVNLFGDSERTDDRLSERFNNLLHSKGIYEGKDNIVTPHDMRAMCETFLSEGKFSEPMIYTFTGHEGKVYIQLTQNQMFHMFEYIYEKVCFDQVPQEKSEKRTTQIEILDKGIQISTNQGMITHYQELYSEISSDSEKAATLDEDREIDMKMAVFIHNIEESVLERVRKGIDRQIEQKVEEAIQKLRRK